ncbi:MAG: Processing peptidase [Candidatus Woesebacteria bacterium GW2011_GWB1_45_5]|uniref:Processing peptidase n=1 Tax=Candidatus Woesebacteria bacterium GW2011_GWB1_45_5 TaxID=1618581 RepID=A0A0G1QP64_9BACT|nr:MAG: Processing peptidase [Candidatus Woesebacteria bacterium GW2011_GWB1_45_5]
MKEYDIRFRSLSNDVRHLEIHMPERETASCIVFVKTGSRNETGPGEAGISHALEHKIYAGSKKRLGTERGLAVDRLGANESANTEKEYTEYYINLHSDYVPNALELLSEIFVRPTFPRGLLKIENKVIVGEIKDYRDDYPSTIQEQFEGLLFDKTNMAKPILGTVASVTSQTRKQLMDYMKRWYKGGNIMVALVGNVRRTGKLVEKYFGKLPPGPTELFEGTAGYGKLRRRVATKDTDQTYFVFGVPALPLGHEDYYAMRIIEIILGGHQVLDERTVQSSKIFEEVRSKRGLAYEISTSSFSGSDTGYIAVGGSVQPRNLHKTLEVVKKEMFDFASTVTREEVMRAKQFFRDYLTTQLDNPNSTAELLGVPALLLNKVERPSEMFEKIDAVNLKNVRDLASKLLVPEEARLAVLGPFDDELRRVPKSQL